MKKLNQVDLAKIRKKCIKTYIMKMMIWKNQLQETKNIKIIVGFAIVGRKYNLNGNLMIATNLQIKKKFLFIQAQKDSKDQRWIIINKKMCFKLKECVLEKEFFIFLLLIKLNNMRWISKILKS